MNTASPLRYPGGKASLTGLLRQIRRLNSLGDRPIAEPFAGGAGASLSLLFREDVPQIYINDADPAVHDFWWSVLNRPQVFAAKLRAARASMAEWRRQRAIYLDSRTGRLDRGFAAFYLNRCNRSGIIMNGGPIGGVRQTGPWKIGARFNKPDLLERCEKVAEFRQRIRLGGTSGLDFIRRVCPPEALLFIDPPYFAKGPTLYLNALTAEDHQALSDELRTRQDAPWILTYDDCPQIRRMYRGWANIRPFSLRYAASERRKGRELLISPRWMRLPSPMPSTAT